MLRGLLTALLLALAATLTGTAATGCSNPNEPSCAGLNQECFPEICCSGTCTAVAVDRSVCRP